MELASWISSRHNMGMTFARDLWNEIKKCAKVRYMKLDYFTCNKFRVYEILRTLNFFVIWPRFYLAFDINPLMHTFINAHLATYLIWRTHMTAKGAK